VLSARGLLAGGGHRARRRQHKIHRISGSGRWFQFGQAPNPNLPWPQFDASSYAASINYDGPSSHVQIVRKQTIEADRQRPVPVEQKPDLYLGGSQAGTWRLRLTPHREPPLSPRPNRLPLRNARRKFGRPLKAF